MGVTVTRKPGLALFVERLEAFCDADTVCADGFAGPAFIMRRDDLFGTKRQRSAQFPRFQSRLVIKRVVSTCVRVCASSKEGMPFDRVPVGDMLPLSSLLHTAVKLQVHAASFTLMKYWKRPVPTVELTYCNVGRGDRQ